ncbi:alpha/beta hydrolase [Chryseobacterium sp. cx-311]|uniref:alpha/beta hydrolase n=1 Tax=Marnyiella aurantia TaxID=2758037 RepID=UPI001AE702BA|nr:alpha/beta hydrolase [Marnyiella aurantia]MBP0613045.1 alpha/beta hydrolase [Marnyiella aurantia]
MNRSILRYTLGLMAVGTLLSCNNKYRVWVGNYGEQKVLNLPYGIHKKQVMDIFLPAQYMPGSPTVMIIHGGAWKYGRKEHMIMIQKYLHYHKIPTINIDYRLASTKHRITYKEQLEDIALAQKKFNTLAPKANLRPDNYILLGESAGAHLALLYGYQNPQKTQKIISLSAPTDFYSSKYTRSLHSWYSAPTLQTMVGSKFSRKNISHSFKEASPIYHISDVPTLLFHGDSDYLVNRNQAITLDSMLSRKGVPHRLIYMKNTGHTPRFFSKYKRDSIILPAILDWIKK